MMKRLLYRVTFSLVFLCSAPPIALGNSLTSDDSVEISDSSDVISGSVDDNPIDAEKNDYELIEPYGGEETVGDSTQSLNCVPNPDDPNSDDVACVEFSPCCGSVRFRCGVTYTTCLAGCAPWSLGSDCRAECERVFGFTDCVIRVGRHECGTPCGWR